jgi:hypothetical protein
MKAEKEISSFIQKQHVQIANKPTVDRHNTIPKLNYCLLTDPPLFSLLSTYKNRDVCAGMPRCSVFLTWCTGKLYTPLSSYTSSMLRNHMAYLLIIIIKLYFKKYYKENLLKLPPPRLYGVPMNACTFLHSFLV